MRDRLPQREIVLRLLKNTPNGITWLDCVRWGGGNRLPARISELKDQGHDITSTMETRGVSRVAVYRLVAA